MKLPRTAASNGDVGFEPNRTAPRPPQGPPARHWSRELTPREQQIARLIASGYSNKEIAAELGISRHTIGSYLRRMFVKVGARSRANMVALLK